MSTINIITCVDNKYGIGKNNKLPWVSKVDMKYFRKITKFTPFDDFKNIVIYGSNTFKSLNKNPLKGRINIVISKKLENENKDNLIIVNSYHEAIKKCHQIKYYKIFIIGGEQIYNLALDEANIDEIHMTTLNENHCCDKFFPISKIKNFTLKKKYQIDKNTTFNIFSHYP